MIKSFAAEKIPLGKTSMLARDLPDDPPKWISISVGKFVWRIHPEFNNLKFLHCLESENLRLAEPIRLDNRPRNTFVARLNLPQCHSVPLIVKRYRSLNFLHSLKERLRSAAAFSAFEKAFILLARNIPTATPIAASKRWSHGRVESYLVTEEVPNARSLREFRGGKFTARENRIVVRRLADVIARLHNEGLSHTDPTLSNFFVQEDVTQMFRIVLIDLDGLRWRRKFSIEKIVRDFVPLFRRIPMSAREKLWFVAQYCRIQKETVRPRVLLSLLTKKFAAPPRRSSATWFLKSGKIRWQIRPGALHQKILTVIKDPESFLKNPALYFKNSRVVTVTRVPAVGDEPALVLRRLNYSKSHHRVRDSFRSSRATRALRRGLMLEQQGISTPRAFAAGDARHFRWPQTAYLITEQIPNAQTLAGFLSGHSPPISLIVPLADLLARMHDQGFSHRDLKPTNILLDGNLKPFLIDLDGLGRFRRVNQNRAADDLARLARGISVHQKKLGSAPWRFLKRYCQQREQPVSVRELANQISEKLRSER